MKETPLLCLDLDGTVREGKDDALGRFVNSLDDVRVFPEAVVLMRQWQKDGGRIIGVSNQGGIALGYMTYNTCLETIKETNRQADYLFDSIDFCRHHPDGIMFASRSCWCRKPSPGMVARSAALLSIRFDEYYPAHLALFVGDREEDKECAKNAQINFMDAKDWRAMANMEYPEGEGCKS